MITILGYWDSTYQFEDIAQVKSISQDEQGWFVILSKTIFYPQGGGQPSDIGCLKTNDTIVPIHRVKMVDGEIRHYTNEPFSSILDKHVNLLIDGKKRIFHSRLHTSGHLISNIVEATHTRYKAIKGHHFPGESYIEFLVRSEEPEELFLGEMNQKISQLISEDRMVSEKNLTQNQFDSMCGELLYSIPFNETIRVVGIEGFKYQPCGGTHIHRLSELNGLLVTKIKLKNKFIRVSYSLDG